ncbi:MAG: PAS domain-containing protein [Planctomycetota bacterium]|jgi:signal transduction histidine kinase|nr:PAS domain-containing protein [Planctomycetota bacterium]
MEPETAKENPEAPAGESPSTKAIPIRSQTQVVQDSVRAMKRFIHFQRQALALKKSQSIDSAFDTMEKLLLEVIDFAYVSLQYRDNEGHFSPLRQICPNNFTLDTSMMEWVMNTQEVSVLPIDTPVSGENLHSLIALPFGGHHLMLLWLEQDADAFTQEQEALLSILSREMAAVLDTHHYRMRLEKARADIASIVESIPIGLFSLDHNNIIQIINPTAAKTLGLARDGTTGVDYHQVIPSPLAEFMDKLPANSGSEETEMVLAGRGNPSPEDGGQETDSQTVGITICPMQNRENSWRNGRIVIIRDLQLSREVKKLRELDAMKDDFLSLVTHEMRTPLTSIMSYSETLMMDENENVPGEWKEYVCIINSEGRRLCKFIDDALDITRMRGGKVDYNFSRQDPNEIIGAALMSLAKGIEEKKLEVEMNLADDLGECNLIADRFSQVAANLVSNAIKFSHPGGKITVSTKKAGPLPGTTIPTLLLSVRDNGIGIAPENLKKIFGDFEIVEDVKNHTAGTGLSLAVCKQIIETGHRGRIWAESELDKGSVFHAQIPIK